MTYSNNIRQEDMSYVRYMGTILVPSNAAIRELTYLGIDLEDCEDILENGYSPRKRAKGTIERWLDVGNKTYNVVVVLLFNELYGENIFLITHVGKFTKRK